MDQNGEEGKLVETGTFRVDAERMLAVLSKYQLETPLHAIRELVRCAVLSGAPKLQLSRAKGGKGTGFEARFAGRPFSQEELSDVYAPLLAGDQGPGRHLAAAVLALSGTRPARLTLASGRAVASPVGGRLPDPEEQGHTSLIALWAEEPAGLRQQAVMDFPVASEAALADIGDDGLLLDASLSGCVRDERFAALQPLLEQKAFALLSKEASRQEISFHAISRLLEKSENRQLWRERMAGRGAKNKEELAREPGLLDAVWRYLMGGGGGEQPYPPTVSETRLRQLEEAGRRTWWLQDACRRALGGSLKEGGSPEAALLRGVPVLFSTLGEPLSLNKVLMRRSNGGLKVLKEFATEQNSDGRHPKDAVWLASDRDREFLRSFVPESEWMD